MNNKLFVFIMLVICFIVAINAVSAADNATETLNVENNDEKLAVDSDDEIADDNEVLAVACNDENQSAVKEDTLGAINDDGSKDDILSSSVSVSSSHSYNIHGYKFKVSDSQYKLIKKAVRMGKKQDFLDNGFTFSVKTYNVVKVKVLVKTKTYYKKVRYEGLTYYPYKAIKLAKLSSYYKKGWKKYGQGYESSNYKSKKYLGYNFVKLKKVVKTYKTVKMRVYAKIFYEGINDYDGYGPHYYFPGVEFFAKKTGYSTKYLDCDLIRY